MSSAQKKYDFETIEDPTVTSGVTPGLRYRIRDVASDNAIAHCYDVANAKFIVDALNTSGIDYMKFMRSTMKITEADRGSR